MSVLAVRDSFVGVDCLEISVTYGNLKRDASDRAKIAEALRVFAQGVEDGKIESVSIGLKYPPPEDWMALLPTEDQARIKRSEKP